MAAGIDPMHPASSLLARWLATAPRSAAAPRPRPESAALEAPPPDAAAILLELERAVRAEGLPPAGARAAEVVLDPLRRAVGAAEAERDPAALLLAFEEAEDVLEALLLAGRPSPAAGG